MSLQRFNSQLENLLNDLIRIFPENKNIKVYREKFLLAKSANPQLILLVFLKYVYPYKQQVQDKNEQFFLSDHLTNEISNNEDVKKDSESDSEYIITQALGIKKLWTRMSDEQKETLWKYFKVLMVLCERYVKEVKS